MSKILITGNGFDLFHGLPTKYGHFMAIMKTLEEKRFDDIISFEDLFSDYFKNQFSNDYNLISQNYNIQNIYFSKNKIEDIVNLLKENSWYKHFKNVLEIETWIDFENEIENLLVDISLIFNNSRNNPNTFNFFRIDKLNIYTDLECFGFVSKPNQLEIPFKKEYLIIKNKKIKEKLILNNLAADLEGFAHVFNKYLIEIVGSFYNFIKVKYPFPIQQINEIYTFNYTWTLEDVYKINPSKIVYLHGRASSNEEVQNIVLGVNEIPEEISKNKAYDFTKYYKKIIKNTNHKFIEIPEKKTNVLNETVFYIIGHSLDKSDKAYILDLFKYLDFDIKKQSKICIFYHDNLDKQNKLNNLFSIVNNETIVTLNKEGRLYFVELNETNINKEFNKTLHKNEGLSIRVL